MNTIKIFEKNKVYYLFFQKTKWHPNSCETTNEKSVLIVLYGKDKKRVLDISTEMENAWYIIKMAEYKNIEIREEKDLTIKQIKEL